MHIIKSIFVDFNNMVNVQYQRIKIGQTIEASALNRCNVTERNCKVCCCGKYILDNCSYVWLVTFNTSEGCMVRIWDLNATPETVAEDKFKEADKYRL